jgi:hypothetical protein
VCFGTLAGALWFGLLFFAGITSSLAMGQPVMAFLEDELKTPPGGGRSGRGRARVEPGHASAAYGRKPVRSWSPESSSTPGGTAARV